MKVVIKDSKLLEEREPRGNRAMLRHFIFPVADQCESVHGISDLSTM